MNCAFIIRKWCYGIKAFWTKMKVILKSLIVFLNFGFGPIWNYLNVFGPFYNFTKFGQSHNFKKLWDWQNIILKFWNWTFLQTFITFWATLQFYKVLGSNYKFRKIFTVAVTVASGNPDSDKRKSGF